MRSIFIKHLSAVLLVVIIMLMGSFGSGSFIAKAQTTDPNSPTNTPTPTSTPTLTQTFTPTATFTLTLTPTLTATPTPEPTNAPNPTETPTETPVPEPTNTPIKPTPSRTPTPTPTPDNRPLIGPQLPVAQNTQNQETQQKKSSVLLSLDGESGNALGTTDEAKSSNTVLNIILILLSITIAALVWWYSVNQNRINKPLEEPEKI